MSRKVEMPRWYQIVRQIAADVLVVLGVTAFALLALGLPVALIVIAVLRNG
ncbi:hypothetical protein MUN78_10280 [Leucobacter allii]|uniref:Uncharacterized protein n=1 Tax=Leucobacter allii TaxID=2932247 RepID=A0ABY4FI75_9MICO|nr:hypothetical protein [Leucobacter allii]UOQ56090.1 hypothetical protein MUN78_10280 [Leucobacter allii]